ncbi:MAG: extracellular solute-binding protein [Lachnospiraceae bacterium]|nr:extracellular solute-binding protein [Lachnospiraceae bacterium]
MFSLQKIIEGIAVATALAVGICGCAADEDMEEYRLAEEQKLTVYTSHKKEIYEPIIKEFEERSGIWVEIVPGGTNELLEKIRFEENGSGGDIMFGGGIDSLEVYSGEFEPYRPTQYDHLDHTYASETDSYTVFSKLPTVLIYNKKMVISAGAPRSWEELLSSRWKGNIAYADPVKSGSSYTSLQTMIQVLSSQYSQEQVLRNFSYNLEHDIAQGSEEAIEAVVAGEKLIGITYEEAALKRIEAGADIGVIYPEQGTTAVPDGCAIIKDAPHQENARLFMEFIVSEDVQRLLEDQLHRRSVREDVTNAEAIEEIPYDLNYSREHREEVLALWEELNP